jgi:cytochrome c peroxidase
MHWRATDSVIDAAYLKYLFWDGRASSLEQQALGPIGAPFEMNMHLNYLVARLYEIPLYRKMFKQVFHTDVITPDMVAKAIASFERTIVVTQTPFYSYVNGDKNALSKQSLAGFKLFTGKAGCIRCHYGPFFTDDGFHALGVPELQLTGEEQKLNAAARHYFAYKAGIKDSNNINRDLGRYFITHKKSDMDKFGTPSLIDAVGPYYMHNGAIQGLLNVVEFFNKGGGIDVPNKSKMLKPLHLTLNEEKELVAFLESLNGPAFVISPPVLPPYAVSSVSGETMSTASGSPTSTGMELVKSQDCLSCHSIHGVGGTMSVDLSDKGVREHSISWLETQIATPGKHFKPGGHEVLLGKDVYNVMPDHPLLTKEQLNAIAIYLKSL